MTRQDLWGTSVAHCVTNLHLLCNQHHCKLFLNKSAPSDSGLLIWTSSSLIAFTHGLEDLLIQCIKVYYGLISHTYKHWTGILHTQPLFPTVCHSLHLNPVGGGAAVGTEEETKDYRSNLMKTFILKCMYLFIYCGCSFSHCSLVDFLYWPSMQHGRVFWRFISRSV